MRIHYFFIAALLLAPPQVTARIPNPTARSTRPPPSPA